MGIAPSQELPEIKRLDLAEVVLTLKAAGVDDLRKFRWLEAPDEKSLAHAEELLTDLGALDKNNFITPVGRKMLAFPLHPRYARMMLAAQEYGCVYQAALVAALTQGRDLLLRNCGKDVDSAREDLLGEKASSDFWILMRAWTLCGEKSISPGCLPQARHSRRHRTTGRAAARTISAHRRTRKVSTPSRAR